MGPDLEPIRVLEFGQMPPDVDHGLLRGVVGAIGVAQDVVGNRVHAITDPDCEGSKRRLVPALCPLHQLAVQDAPSSSTHWFVRGPSAGRWWRVALCLGKHSPAWEEGGRFRVRPRSMESDGGPR